MLRLCTNFEVRRPSRSEVIVHLGPTVFIVFLALGGKQLISNVSFISDFHPHNFGLPRPFRSRVLSRHATDRQTDGRTDGQPRAIYNAPSPTGAGA